MFSLNPTYLRFASLVPYSYLLKANPNKNKNENTSRKRSNISGEGILYIPYVFTKASCE